MSLRSTITAALAAATILTTAGAAFAAPGVTLGAVNFREEPGGDIMYALPKGKFVDILDCDGGWCEVEVNDDEGYVSAKYLALIDDDDYEDDDDYHDDDDHDDDHHHDDDPDVEVCIGGGGFGGGGFGYGSFCIED